jgi:hypothetical protein
MKKYMFNPRLLLIAICILMISLSGYSQGEKLSRKDRKEAKKAQEYAYFHYLDTLLTNKEFVLEADFIENQYGQRLNVAPLLNFIRVDSERATLQTDRARTLVITESEVLRQKDSSTNMIFQRTPKTLALLHGSASVQL